MDACSMRLGFAFTGSFCTMRIVTDTMRSVKEKGYDIFPIMSETVYSTDTRFGKCKDFINEIEDICGRKIISTVTQAEPIGPKKLIDALVIAPCTGNTLGKLAAGINDGCVMLSAKATLRNNCPVIIAPSTNDGLGASAKNIGQLLNTKNIYFVPFGQDDPVGKNNSLVAKWEYLLPAVESALKGKQFQPVLM
ncbi:MAG: dipicolinate synthase subunit B [Ruminococcaceae bacterium]|nr:dipicolinate synthase subunit B [Oscillospiraceae bacterium]